jgi:hypothetical protein
VKASHSNKDAATHRTKITHCVNVARPEKRLTTVLASHEMRLGNPLTSHSRNHSSGLSVLGHRNMMLDHPDKLTINDSRFILIALLTVQPGGTRHRRCH